MLIELKAMWGAACKTLRGLAFDPDQDATGKWADAGGGGESAPTLDAGGTRAAFQRFTKDPEAARRAGKKDPSAYEVGRDLAFQTDAPLTFFLDDVNNWTDKDSQDAYIAGFARQRASNKRHEKSGIYDVKRRNFEGEKSVWGARAAFEDDQARDDGGRWTNAGTRAAKALAQDIRESTGADRVIFDADNESLHITKGGKEYSANTDGNHEEIHFKRGKETITYQRRAAEIRAATFNDEQPRDEHGRWVAGAGGSLSDVEYTHRGGDKTTVDYSSMETAGAVTTHLSLRKQGWKLTDPRAGVKLTQKQAFKQVQEHGLTIKRTGFGEEYRVSFPGGEKSEASAHYTDDLDDAVATAKSMARIGNKRRLESSVKYLSLSSGKVESRQETLNGKDYTVIPVVGLVEGVITALNSDGSEFVPADVFKKAPSAWNGRPIFLGHPMADGEPVSGNSPKVLAKSLGMVFNASIKDEKLMMEAWLENAKLTGTPEGVSIAARLNTGDPIEISIGTLVEALQEDGVFRGKPYKGRWANILPDHLALLDKGKRGACSREAGCGVRALEQKQVDETRAAKFADLVNEFRVAIAGADMSDNDRRNALQTTLAANGVSGYVDALYPSYFVYSAYPSVVPSCGCGPLASGQTRVQYFAVDYTIDKKTGVVSLELSSKEQVEPILRYEPVTDPELRAAAFDPDQARVGVDKPNDKW